MNVDEFERIGLQFVKLTDCLHHNRFVFNRTDGTCRIDNQRSGFGKIDCSLQYLHLQAVKVHAVDRLPVTPPLRQLSDRSVAGTRRVDQNFVKKNRLLFVGNELSRVVHFLLVDSRKKLGSVVHNSVSRKVESLQLMGKNVCTLVLDIVRDNSTVGLGNRRGIRVQKLQHLHSFGPWGSAGVEDKVVSFQIQKQWRKHRNKLLSRQKPAVCCADKILPQLLNSGVFSEGLVAQIDLISQVARKLLKLPI